MTINKSNLRAEYLTGEGFLGGFVFSYREELDRTRFFLKTMEDFVEASEREEVAALEQGIARLTPEQHDEYWQWHYPFHWQEIFSNRLRTAFVLQLCTFLEGELNEICRRVEVIAEAPIGVGDLKGSTLDKAQKYLSAFAHFDRPSESSWALIQRIYHVRNVMVHYGGFSFPYRHHAKIVAFSGEAPGLSLQNDFIQVKREFCEFCLAEVSRFFADLHAAYEAFRAACQALVRVGARGFERT